MAAVGAGDRRVLRGGEPAARGAGRGGAQQLPRGGPQGPALAPGLCTKTRSRRAPRARAAGGRPLTARARARVRQEREITALRASLAEAEAGKQGMLARINTLLTRAQQAEALRAPAPEPTQDPAAREAPPPLPLPGQHAAPLPPPSRAAAPGVASAGGEATIGVEVARDEAGLLRVTRLAPGSSAAQGGGVQPGDVLMAVDGTSMRGLGPAETRALLEGARGSAATLEIQRTNTAGLLYATYVRVPRDVPAGAPPPPAAAAQSPPPTPAPRPSPDPPVLRPPAPAPPIGDDRCSVGLLVRRDARGWARPTPTHVSG